MKATQSRIEFIPNNLRLVTLRTRGHGSLTISLVLLLLLLLMCGHLKNVVPAFFKMLEQICIVLLPSSPTHPTDPI